MISTPEMDITWFLESDEIWWAQLLLACRINDPRWTCCLTSEPPLPHSKPSLSHHHERR